MEDINFVQRSETLDDLDENAPDVFLLEVCLLFLMTRNFLEHITVVRVLHNNALPS